MKHQSKQTSQQRWMLTLPPVAVIWVVLYGMSRVLSPSDMMGYSLLSFYLVQPLAALAGCAWVACGTGWFKWVTPVLYALFYWTLPIAVFQIWEPVLLLLTLIPGVVGVLGGHLWCWWTRRKRLAG